MDLQTDRLFRATCVVLLGALLVTTLSLGAKILLPLIEAILVWFVINRLAEALRRIPRLGPRLGPGSARLAAGVLVLLLAFLAIYSGVRGVLTAGPQALNLQTSLDPLVRALAGFLGTDEARIVQGVIDRIGIETLMQQIVLALLAFLNQAGVVAIYVIFLFADQAFLPDKTRALFPDPERRARAQTILSRIGQSVSSYLWIMTKVSALTAGLSYVVLLIMGVNYPVFWAVLIFLLNFIPTIGSILGTVLPVAYALVQSPDLGQAAILVVLLGGVQMTMGNVVFPRMVGTSFNLSLLVTILCLFFWGMLWGVTGMFLAVPMTAIVVIVLGHFDETRAIAILLSKDGNILDADHPDAGPDTAPAAGPDHDRD